MKAKVIYLTLLLILAQLSQLSFADIDLVKIATSTRSAVFQIMSYGQDGTEISRGTGFLVSSDGKLVTNHHVIENAYEILAKADNGGIFSVKSVLSSDSESDLALLKLNASGMSFLNIAIESNVVQGDRIAVVGCPLGLEGTVSEGLISAIRMKSDKTVYQITAAVSPGSSGSPVLNSDGLVIGVAYASLIDGQSLNFAIPSSDIIALLDNTTSAYNLKANVLTDKPKTLGSLAWGKTRWGMTADDLMSIFENDFRLPKENSISNNEGDSLSSHRG